MLDLGTRKGSGQRSSQHEKVLDPLAGSHSADRGRHSAAANGNLRGSRHQDVTLSIPFLQLRRPRAGGHYLGARADQSASCERRYCASSSTCPGERRYCASSSTCQPGERRYCASSSTCQPGERRYCASSSTRQTCERRFRASSFKIQGVAKAGGRCSASWFSGCRM